MRYGFLRCAAVSPALRVADCEFNAQAVISAMKEALDNQVRLLCLPELSLTGYTCSDLFLQQTLYEGAESALVQILEASRELDLVTVVGLPVQLGGCGLRRAAAGSGAQDPPAQLC